MKIADTNSIKEDRVRDYINEWYPTTPDGFEVDWDNVLIRVSGRLTRARGRAKTFNRRNQKKKGAKYQISIAEKMFENFDWNEITKTIRHEAVHIWQYQTDNVSSGHGWSFERWEGRFNIEKSCNSPPTKDWNYLLECEKCGGSIGRQRKSKIVKNPEMYTCGDCGGEIVRVK